MVYPHALPEQVAVVQALGALQEVHVPPLQPQLAVVPEHALPREHVDTAALQLLLPAAQPYAACVGCCTEQLFAPVMLQYWEQLADVHPPLHQTWPALVAYWYCVPGLVVGQVAVEPSQLLYVLEAMHAPLLAE